MNGPERWQETKFWRGLEQFTKESAARLAEAEATPPSRCKVCGEYDDDPSFPCACRE